MELGPRARPLHMRTQNHLKSIQVLELLYQHELDVRLGEVAMNCTALILMEEKTSREQ